ncbi:MAG: Type IV pilus biogenesis protein PilQ [uncultured Thiotrichaceae bacterium]|uniref:Type IV pilus biogenesis protein PilQ n=1 Tax=uncultured Thiotrichaceae bacterium TaxID=298394 RepID=A0A6S6SI71_9GAMM|nr:MAG: Type IV pilus biogenesis protein PilQ [uncultured Thiotrichaceae bacterium]
MKKIKQTAFWFSCGLLGCCLNTASAAVLNKLQVIDVKPGAANKTEVRLDFQRSVTIPKGFILENPPRIVFDFPQVEVLPKARRNATGAGVVKSISSANNKGQTRVVVALKTFVDYSVEARGDDLVLIFNAPAGMLPAKRYTAAQQQAAQNQRVAGKAVADQSYEWYRNPSAGRQQPAQQMVAPRHQPKARPVQHPVPPALSVAQQVQRPAQQRPVQRVQQQPARVAAPRPAPRQSPAAVNALRGVDFRRNANGGGRVIVTLPHGNVDVSDDKRANILNLTLHDLDVPANWRKRLDVLDFATPVSGIQISQRGGNGHLSIIGNTGFKYRTEKNRNVYTVHIDKIETTKKKLKLGEQEKRTFNGEKLSLNFQDIEVRAVLQLLADFTDKNIVVSDSVNGSITVRLKDVPWDQALNIVLESKNLGMRENGSVIWVAPSSELDAKDARALEIARRKIELEPVVTEYIPINYAKAADLLQLIERRSTGEEEGHSLLSQRGSVSSDERTNTLLVKDTAEQIAQIRDLIKVLDVPVQQVLIESRIVIANDEFGKELGARFGASPRWLNNDSIGLGAGSLNGASDTYYNSIASGGGSAGGETVTIPNISDRLNVNLPVIGSAGSFGFSILTSDFMLDLELSALQAESKGEIVATPRVITSNQTKAIIEQGVEIPYQQASSSGATNIAFKKAVLSLEVTPQITPDEHVSMDLKVNQDTVGTVFNSVPSIDTREIQTKVLVENGQTIVLGGVHEETNINGTTKVPVLGDLPVVGRLFRKTNKSENKRELLIFVTPKIVDSSGKKVAGR